MPDVAKAREFFQIQPPESQCSHGPPKLGSQPRGSSRSTAASAVRMLPAALEPRLPDHPHEPPTIPHPDHKRQGCATDGNSSYIASRIWGKPVVPRYER